VFQVEIWQNWQFEGGRQSWAKGDVCHVPHQPLLLSKTRGVDLSYIIRISSEKVLPSSSPSQTDGTVTAILHQHSERHTVKYHIFPFCYELNDYKAVCMNTVVWKYRYEFLKYRDIIITKHHALNTSKTIMQPSTVSWYIDENNVKFFTA